jgi:hypothetical protein
VKSIESENLRRRTTSECVTSECVTSEREARDSVFNFFDTSEIVQLIKLKLNKKVKLPFSDSY